MTVQSVLMYPDKMLRKKCTPVDEVDDNVLEVIQNLKDTCRTYRAHGLSAPQIGETLRIFVTHTGADEPTVFINPELVEPEDSGVPGREGCLSFPGVEAEVKRFGDVCIKALDEDGEEFTLSLDGLAAVAVQHELDHLDGILLIDHLSPLQRRFVLKRVKKVLSRVQRAQKPTKKPQSSPRAKARKERKRQRVHRKSA